MFTRSRRSAEVEELSLDEGIWLFSSFSAIYQIPFDATLFARQYPAPTSLQSLSEVAAELGLVQECRKMSLKASLAQRLPVAFLTRTKCISQESADTTSWVLAVHADEDSVWILRAGASEPDCVKLIDFDASYVGMSLSMWPRSAAMSDPDDVEPRKARFGFRWFANELSKFKSIWKEVIVASLAIQLIALATPLFTQVIIDKVIVHRTTSTLIALGSGLVIFLVFTSLLTWVRQYLVLHTGQRIDAVLGSRVFDHLFRLPAGYFQNRPTGVITARLHGIESIREFIASAAVTVVLDLPFLLIFVAIMFWYSVPLTFIVLGVLTLIALLSALVTPLFRERLNEQFSKGAATQAFLTEYVAGVETVKSLQFEPQLNHRYRNLLADYLKASFVTRQLANTYNTWANTLEQVMTLGVLLCGAWLAMSNTAFTVGMLVAFQMFSGRLSQPVLRIVGLWQQWQQTRMSVARLGDIMNAPTETYSIAPTRVHSNRAGEIDVESLSFRYNDSRPFLYKDVSFNFPPGQLTAIMGASGTGKSTLAKLLQGFFVPSGGVIKVDGIDIASMSANELRANFGVVPQETVLFSGTILSNLKLANPFATFDQVVAACKMAEVHSVIESLPEGYQTEIGERGSGLSGGQRQRISIARALLKAPKVLIFDEATSSVDAHTGEQLAKTINALRGRTTILFISHQLPKSLQVDQAVRIGDKLSVVQNDRADTASSSALTERMEAK